MRAYVIATGVIFGLLTVVHVWRIVEEPHLAREPWFLLATGTSAIFCFVAWRLARRSKSS